MMDFKIQFKDDALEKQIKRALKQNPEQTVKAIRSIALDLSGKSARRAPIESGDLRNNCSAELNGITIFENKTAIQGVALPTTKAYANISYSLPYALKQHEELKYNHDRTDGHKRSDGTKVNMIAGGEAKFLEHPFNENEEKYYNKITQIVENSLK